MRIKNTINYQNLEKLFGFTRQTWSKWKKEGRPIVKLIEDSFTNDEIELFLESKKIPFKIEFVNSYFPSFYLKFTKILIDDDHILHIVLFNSSSIEQLRFKAFELYEKGIIFKNDLIYFLSRNEIFGKSDDGERLFIAYIDENLKTNWKIFKEEIKRDGISLWLILYLEIMILAAKENCLNKVFGDANGPEEESWALVPVPPPPFAAYEDFEEVAKSYNEILLSVKEGLLKKHIHNLPRWSIYDAPYNLNTTHK